jgi:hypothetical protein
VSLFGGSQREDRRRRVLSDAASGSSVEPSTASSTQTASSGSSALAASVRRVRQHSPREMEAMDRQPRIIDLIPQRYTSYALLLAVGLTMIVGLEAAYYFMPDIARFAGASRLAAIDLGGDNGLGVWLSSMLLGLSSITALIVYYVRRHKADDYHARYRVWLWAAAAWFVMSVDESASLHEGFAQIMTHTAGTTVRGNGSIWWIGAYLMVLGPVAIRLMLDMRRSRLSTATMIAAVACWSAAVVARLDLALPERGTMTVMIEEGAELAGNLLLLLAMGLHARFVIRDSQGLITAKPAKAKVVKKEPSPAKPAASAPVKRSDLASTPKPSAGASSAPASTSSSPLGRARYDSHEDDDYEDEYEERSSKRDKSNHRIDDEEEGGGRKLNKADRKAMRRAKEQQRRGL